MKTKPIVSLMFLVLILTACGPNPSESSVPTTSEDLSSEVVSSEDVTRDEPHSESRCFNFVNEDPHVSPKGY